MKYEDNDFYNKTILIDADSLCYTAIGDSFEVAKEKLEWKIQKIRNVINYSGEKFIYYLTVGKTFRNILQNDYKANRKYVKSDNVKLLKEYFIENYSNKEDSDVIFEEGFEADDLICDKYREDSDNYVICSIDKDILYNMVGTHINLYDLSIVKTNEEDSIEHFFIQIIKGDPVDNIPNLMKGIGPVKLKIMKELTNLSYEDMGKYICYKKNIDYKTRYRMLYCGKSEDIIVSENKIIENIIIDSYISFGKYIIDKPEKIKKETIIEKVSKRKIKLKDKIDFGKYKNNMVWGELYYKDRNYFNWLNINTNDKRIKDILKFMIDNYNQ